MSLPERWLVLRARVVGAHASDDRAALLSHALTEVGGRAVQEEEGGWRVTHLTPAAAGDSQADGWRGRLAGALGVPVDALEVETAWQEHGDWARLWKVGLEPRRITPRLVVTPSWCTPDLRPGDRVITVDPGMAFGNAEHGTTRGCLRLLDALVRRGDRILDLGAGSAILSIAAALLGAASVHAVEMDELAVPTARENVEHNGVADRVTVQLARLDADGVAARGVHDGVVANIEAGLLSPLVPGLVAATRPGGWLVLSGILDHEEGEMRRLAEAHGVRWAETDADGEWRSLLLRRER